jgi:hypothetical protein
MFLAELEDVSEMLRAESVFWSKSPHRAVIASFSAEFIELQKALFGSLSDPVVVVQHNSSRLVIQHSRPGQSSNMSSRIVVH